MRRAFALRGVISGELLTFYGRVLVHDNRAELEWIFPKEGVDIVEVPIPIEGRPTMPIQEHPQFEGVSWPLVKSEWNTGGRSSR